MSIFDYFRGRNPTTDEKVKVTHGNAIQMVTTVGEHYYGWNGKLYDSDLVRACIRPTVQAVGKLYGKHIKLDSEGMALVNAEPRLRFLLEEPNPYMTGQQFLEKMTTNLLLNNNAFALIIRDRNGYPIAMYPVNAMHTEVLFDDQANCYLRFTYKNGNTGTFHYEDIIHLKRDYYSSDILGDGNGEALAALMECVGTIDQGIVKAVKNSSLIRWLLQFKSSMRPEDVKRGTVEFVNNYLTSETESFGAAGIDAKADIKQIEPKDYVPNAGVTDRIVDRIYSYFNTNKNIVQGDFDEDQWNSYYELVIAPIAQQISEVFTIRLLSRRERSFGQKIKFESANLAYASMKTKLALTDFLDRGIMNANEIREYMSLAAIPGGDEYVRRLDTVPIDENGNPDTSMLPDSQQTESTEQNEPDANEGEQKEESKTKKKEGGVGNGKS